MPRPNKQRSIESEANLAERIAEERESAGLSYEALAKKMTDVGCSITGSAIYRIEKPKPGKAARKVTVDELVAFAEVFGRDVMDMLRPMEFVRQEHARRLAAELAPANRAFDDAVGEVLRVYYEYGKVAAQSPELLEFINHQIDWKDELSTKSVDLGDGVTQDEVDDLRRETVAFWAKIVSLASKAAGPMAEAD